MRRKTSTNSTILPNYYVNENHRTPVKIAQVVNSNWTVTNTLGQIVAYMEGLLSGTSPESRTSPGTGSGTPVLTSRRTRPVAG